MKIEFQTDWYEAFHGKVSHSTENRFSEMIRAVHPSDQNLLGCATGRNPVKEEVGGWFPVTAGAKWEDAFLPVLLDEPRSDRQS